MVWGEGCAGNLQSFAFSHLEKWDFVLFLWLMGENGPSRELRVSPDTVQHALRRFFSLFVGHPVERTVLTWVSPTGWAPGQSGWPGWGSRAHGSMMSLLMVSLFPSINLFF